jgi:hypothetical protein
MKRHDLFSGALKESYDNQYYLVTFSIQNLVNEFLLFDIEFIRRFTIYTQNQQ